ncbi:MAG: PhnD/SsuA/transferrin family substrate-binding protein [Rhodothermales bacterium]|nr:PhnD/SsuA/transferrin family substrate-binding protein [Rhodothermales bacterium]
MIASLPMYDRPEISGAVASYWKLIHESLADHGQSSPTTLTQDGEDVDTWLSPELCMCQTCGLPYRIWLHDKVGLVGTPDYALDDCPPGFYRSVVVVHADDQRDTLEEFRTGTLAFNSLFSQSGYAALRNHLSTDTQWPEQQTNTGSHQASIQAIASGKADIASIDAVTWRLAERYDKAAQQLRVLTYTEATPGLPYITVEHNDATLFFKAVKLAIDALSDTVRNQLGLRGLVFIDKSTYLAIPTPSDVLSRK